MSDDGKLAALRRLARSRDARQAEALRRLLQAEESHLGAALRLELGESSCDLVGDTRREALDERVQESLERWNRIGRWA
jgi:hypothetical protein